MSNIDLNAILQPKGIQLLKSWDKKSITIKNIIISCAKGRHNVKNVIKLVNDMMKGVTPDLSVKEPVTEAPIEEPVVETPVEETVTEAPIEETIAEAPVEETVTEAPIEEPVAEETVTEAPAEEPAPVVEDLPVVDGDAPAEAAPSKKSSKRGRKAAEDTE